MRPVVSPRRSLPTVLALVVVLFLAGCAGRGAAPSAEEDGAAAAPRTTEGGYPIDPVSGLEMRDFAFGGHLGYGACLETGPDCHGMTNLGRNTQHTSGAFLGDLVTVRLSVAWTASSLASEGLRVQVSALELLDQSGTVTSYTLRPLGEAQGPSPLQLELEDVVWREAEDRVHIRIGAANLLGQPLRIEAGQTFDVQGELGVRPPA